ncbi:MAG: metallophosphoesterase, partial [Thermoguttaceae bacterium]
MKTNYHRNILLCIVLCLVFQISYSYGGEPDTLKSSAEIAHGPYLLNMDENGVTVVWVTSVPAKSWVEVTPFTENQKPENNLTSPLKFYEKYHGSILATNTLHTVRVSGLKPNSKYSYKVVTQKLNSWNGGYDIKLDEKVEGESNVFKTFDNTKKSTSFVVLNDIHENNELMRDLLASAGLRQTNRDNRDVDFVVYNGDMAHTIESEDHLFSAFQDTGTEIFGETIPLFYARGNHETRGKFACNMSCYFPSKDNRFYYLFRQGPVACIVLDGGEDKADNHWAYFTLADYDDYRQEEADWLKNAIQSKEFTSADFRIVVMHIPPNTGQNNTETVHGATQIYEKFVPIL